MSQATITYYDLPSNNTMYSSYWQNSYGYNVVNNVQNYNYQPYPPISTFYPVGNDSRNITPNHMHYNPVIVTSKPVTVPTRVQYGQRRKHHLKNKNVCFDNEICVVCGDKASGYHYSSMTCEGCKGFFLRSITRKTTYQCKFDKACQIDTFMRRKCQYCRLKKCIDRGMRTDLVLPEELNKSKREAKPQKPSILKTILSGPPKIRGLSKDMNELINRIICIDQNHLHISCRDMKELMHITMQQFGRPFYSVLVPRVKLLTIRCRHDLVHEQNYLLKFLESKFDPHHIKVDFSPKFKISVSDPTLRGMPLFLQQKCVMDSLLEHIKHDVFIETLDVPEAVDREVRRVYLNKNVRLPDNNVPTTPQSFLDSAIYHLSKQSGLLASESLWLCGSLAIKNFGINNGFDPKRHTSKNHIVSFLKRSFKEFRPQLKSSWNDIQICHQNGYEDDLSLDEIQDYLESAELFCNILFDIHNTKKFDINEFKSFLRESMIEKPKDYFDFK